jgi:hypothetical protein
MTLPLIQVVWPPYTGLSKYLLSLILFVVAGGVFLAARRMEREIPLPRMGKVGGAVVFVLWAFCILFFLKINEIFAKYVGAAKNLGPIFPITIISAVATFGFAAYMSRRGGVLSSFGNGFLAFIAGPMVFELPYVLIVIPLVKAPLFATILFVTPLFGIIFTTFGLLLLSRRIALTKNSVYSFAAMIFVFALWALDGYAYPTNALTITLNGISKVLGFVCIAALFVRSSAEVSKQSQEKLAETGTEKSGVSAPITK